VVQLRLMCRAGAKLEAWAFDLSKGSLGMNLPYGLAVSIRIAVRLRGRHVPGLVILLARVVHTDAQANGNWRIWCAFEKPLPKYLLDTLSQPLPVPPLASQDAAQSDLGNLSGGCRI